MTYNAQQKQTAEKIWLHYFNDVLYKQGIISENERNKMTLKIEGRKSPAQKTRSVS